MNKKILLVEDDVWLAELYQMVLSSTHREVIIAGTAVEALKVLDDHERIDLIILDMFLPEHNGIEFLHEAASYTDTNVVPVIVLSSVSQSDLGMSEARWHEYGVVQYLYKPKTKPQDLLAAVKKQLVGSA